MADKEDTKTKVVTPGKWRDDKKLLELQKLAGNTSLEVAKLLFLSLICSLIILIQLSNCLLPNNSLCLNLNVMS